MIEVLIDWLAESRQRIHRFELLASFSLILLGSVMIVGEALIGALTRGPA